jgi:hypothetical protein
MERRIESPLLDLQDLAGELLQPLRNRVAVERPEGHDVQDQKV